MVSSNNNSTILTGDSSRNFITNVILRGLELPQVNQPSINISYTNHGFSATIPDLDIAIPEIIESKSTEEFTTSSDVFESFSSYFNENEFAYNQFPLIENAVSKSMPYGYKSNNCNLGETSETALGAA